MVSQNKSKCVGRKGYSEDVGLRDIACFSLHHSSALTQKNQVILRQEVLGFPMGGLLPSPANEILQVMSNKVRQALRTASVLLIYSVSCSLTGSPRPSKQAYWEHVDLNKGIAY